MKIALQPSEFTSKDEFVRAALSKARDLASDAWDKEHAKISRRLVKEVTGMTKQELARRLIRLMNRPARRRAVISDVMRREAAAMRKSGKSVREIATELGVSIPSVYNITGK